MAYQWYVESGEQRRGPYTSADIKRMADAGKLNTTDRLWRDGLRDAVDAGRVEGLFAGAPKVAPGDFVLQVMQDDMPQPDLPPPLPALNTVSSGGYAGDAEKSPQSGQSELSGPSDRAPMIGSRNCGVIIMLAGLGLMLYGMFAEKTVGPEYGERTYNIGLLTESTNLVIFGAAIFLAGVINLGVVRLLQSLPARNGK